METRKRKISPGTSQSSLSTTTRSASPTKNTASLARLEKPVHFFAFGDDASTQLPPDVIDLYNSIHDIVKYGGAFLPAAIRSEMARLMKGREPPAGLYLEAHEEDPLCQPPPWICQDTASPTCLALDELRVVGHLEKNARNCLELRQSEAAWNCAIHHPVLELALWQHQPQMDFFNTTSAKILPAFMPAFQWGNVTNGKMVDFTICPRSGHDDSLYAAIRSTVSASPLVDGREVGINQTDYKPLLDALIAISIETKVGGASLDEGRVQLAVWAAAWHHRMLSLGIGRPTADTSASERLVTLPLILTLDHEWSLYFACDRGTKIVSPGPLSIRYQMNQS
jgi:hypothetical protein